MEMCQICHSHKTSYSYGRLWVITGYFYGVIHSINGLISVLITGISGHNCIEDGLPALYVISNSQSLWTMSGTEFSGDWPATGLRVLLISRSSLDDVPVLLAVFSSAFLHSTTLRMQLHKGCQIVWANMFTIYIYIYIYIILLYIYIYTYYTVYYKLLNTYIL